MKNYSLVTDWHKAWQWASVRCMATALALQGAWEAIPDDLRAQAPHGMVNHATEALLLLGLLGRLVKKDGQTAEPAKPVQVVSAGSAGSVVKPRRISGKRVARGQSHTKNGKKAKRQTKGGQR